MGDTNSAGVYTCNDHVPTHHSHSHSMRIVTRRMCGRTNHVPTLCSLSLCMRASETAVGAARVLTIGRTRG